MRATYPSSTPVFDPDPDATGSIGSSSVLGRTAVGLVRFLNILLC